MRDYTFSVNELMEDIMCKPWEDNVTLGDKYNISRERVRQVRLMLDLPTVTEAKESWFRQNFDMLIEQAKDGNFIWNSDFMKNYPLSNRKATELLKSDSELNRRYTQEGVEVYNDKVYNPTSKVCLVCDEDKLIQNYYKSPSDKTKDGHARVCIVCNKKNVAKHYEKRKHTIKVIPDFKKCSAVPEVGELPKSDFRKMTTSNTGLQPQCSIYQDFFLKFRKKNSSSEARELARQATIWYYEKI